MPEVADGRDLSRGVDQHRNIALVGNGDHFVERQRARREARSREIQHAHRSRRECGLQLRALRRWIHPDLNHLRARLPRGLVVSVALGAMDDHFGARLGHARKLSDGRRIVTRDTPGDADRHTCCRTGRNVAGLVAGQFRDALAHAALQLDEIDKSIRSSAHRIDDRRRHA